jgi:hypothetical protein
LQRADHCQGEPHAETHRQQGNRAGGQQRTEEERPAAHDQDRHVAHPMPVAGHPEAAEDAQDVGGEWRGGERGEQERIGAFAAGDHGQEIDDERVEESGAQGAHCVEAEIPAHSAFGVRRGGVHVPGI